LTSASPRRLGADIHRIPADARVKEPAKNARKGSFFASCPLSSRLLIYKLKIMLSSARRISIFALIH
jgi:hypothetical protein